MFVPHTSFSEEASGNVTKYWLFTQATEDPFCFSFHI